MAFPWTPGCQAGTFQKPWTWCGVRNSVDPLSLSDSVMPGEAEHHRSDEAERRLRFQIAALLNTL